MLTENEIITKYKTLHDELTECYYKGHELTKEEFDLQHGAIWNAMEQELIAGGFLEVPPVPRDLAKEIDMLEARVTKLEPLFFPEGT